MWDRLGDISGSINYICKIKKKFAKEVGMAYQGTTHTDTDTSRLVWMVADKARDE